MKINFEIPKEVDQWIQSQMAEWGLSPKKMAGAIQELSNYFVFSAGEMTPWPSVSTGAAYFTYFFPLNLVRAQSLVIEAQGRNFFSGLTDVYDFGAGLGSASMALWLSNPNLKFNLIEASTVPEAWAQKSPLDFYKNVSWMRTMNAGRLSDPKKSLGLFSYSLVEQVETPEWLFNCEALMIIEPSTQISGRKLLELRTRLIESGYTILAPCLHQGECPLRLHSKTDWCHHRIGFSAPPWLEEIERHLSFKNRTLTYSYLLARKTIPDVVDLPVTDTASGTKAPLIESPSAAPRAKAKSKQAGPANLLERFSLLSARVVGDPLKEKGKTRQMICRSSEREFLSMLERTKMELNFDRGEIVEIKGEITNKSNELRLNQMPESWD